MTLLTVEELTARVETPLKPAELQALLDSIQQDLIDLLGNPYVDTSTTISETHAGYTRDVFLTRPVLTVDTVTEYTELASTDTGTELTEGTHFHVWPKEGRLQRMTN